MDHNGPDPSGESAAQVLSLFPGGKVAPDLFLPSLSDPIPARQVFPSLSLIDFRSSSQEQHLILSICGLLAFLTPLTSHSLTSTFYLLDQSQQDVKS